MSHACIILRSDAGATLIVVTAAFEYSTGTGTVTGREQRLERYLG
ncbi:hypothetical protein FHT00_003028 [Sphingomonas insulae]|jgi:hypothetical protein|nr:hypothetical protein [Sphingomonas insulae]